VYSDPYFLNLHAMPRRPRLDLPNVTQHVVQRGNHRRPCFFTDVDYERHRSDLQKVYSDPCFCEAGGVEGDAGLSV
jgi:hypothetical protein